MKPLPTKKTTKVLLALVIPMLLLGEAVAARGDDALSRWQQVNPTRLAIRGLSYGSEFGGTGYIAVGDEGLNLIPKSSGNSSRFWPNATATNRLNALSGGLIVGDGGIMILSEGFAVDSPTTASLRAISYVTNSYVVVGDAGTILTSFNRWGEWVKQQSVTSNALAGVTFGNGMFVAVGASGTIITSVDETNWQDHSVSVANSLNGIIFANGIFVAVGSAGAIFTSADAASWSTTDSKTTNQLNAVAFQAGLFTAVGDRGTIVSSTNGIAWFRVSSPTTNDLYAACAAGATNQAAGGANGTIIVGNGTRWQRAAFAPMADLHAVTYADDRFVAVGDAEVLSSAGVLLWFEEFPESGKLPTLYGVARGGNATVVVGVGAPLVSTNQSSFRRASSPAGASDLFIAAAYGAGTFVAVGFSTNIITSRDGFVWNAGPSLGPLTGLTYANGRFVAVGTNVFTSVDGATWEMGHLDSGMNLEDVVYGAGTFVSVGNGGTIAVSPYGLSWIRVNSGVKTDLLGVAYAAGNFVAVGDAGVILTSTDGRTWQRRPSPVASFLWSVAYGNGTFVAVGNGGVSLQSGVLVANPTPFQLGEGQIFSNGHFGLTVFGQVGQSYSIEASSNLIDWMPLGSVIATNSAMQFLDHTAPPPSWRFYRGVSGVAAQ